MADKKISALTAASTPLAGTEVLPIVQSGSTVKVAVSDLTAGRSVSATGLDITGTASRITGDFSSSTNAGSDRTSFQSSTSNGNTILNVIPNGTGTSAQVRLFGNSTLTNASMGQLVLTGTTEFRIAAQIAGTGTYVPINFYTNNAKQFEILTTGDVKTTTGNLVQGTAAKGVTTGGSFSLGLGTNGSTSQATLATDNTFAVTGVVSGGLTNRQGTYTQGTTTPSVAGVSYMVVANSSATSITNFTNAVDGQLLFLKFNDANTTITRNNAYLAGGVNFTSGQDDTLTLISIGGLWYEIARSANA